MDAGKNKGGDFGASTLPGGQIDKSEGKATEKDRI